MAILALFLSCAPQAQMSGPIIDEAPPADSLGPVGEELYTDVSAIKHQQEHITLQLEKIDRKMKESENGVPK